jgi:hypothetical protein
LGVFFSCADFQVREELYVSFFIGGAIDVVDLPGGSESFDWEVESQGILLIDEIFGRPRIQERRGFGPFVRCVDKNSY